MKRWLWIGVFAASLWPAMASANMLLEIYQLAQKEDARFAAARAAYQAGLEAWPQARASVLPSLSVSGSYSRVERTVEQTPFSGRGAGPSAPFSDSFSSHGYGVVLRQPLFNWAIPATLKKGHVRVDIAQLRFLSARQTLAARVITAYFGFLKAQASLNLLQAEKEAIAADLKRTRGLYEVGAISITALRQAQAAMDLAESRIISARAKLDRKREQLRRLTTRWYESLPDLAKRFDPRMPQPSDIDAWVRRTLKYNPQYLAAVHKVELAQAEIQQRRADYIPKLDLVASYRANDNADFMLGRASHDTTIGLQLSWQLFAGGRNISEVQEAQALWRQAQAQAESASRRLTAQTRNAYRRVVTQLRRLEALAAAVESARVAYRSVKAEFEVGTRTKADVIDARRDLFSALVKRARAKYDYIIALGQLQLSAGMLTAEDLKRIDALLAPPGRPPQLPVAAPE